MILEPNDIDVLIGKQLSGEISGEEKVMLDAWINFSEENQAYANQFKVLFEESATLKLNERFDTDTAWIKLKSKIAKQNGRQRTLQLVWRMAAAVVILCSAGFFAYQELFKIQDQTELSAQQIVIDKKLPDGTEVSLNKNTSLAYEYDPVKKTRKTKLQGEAYFKIAENKKRDFIIHAGDLMIKDIGTAFNVKAYPESDTVEIFVEDGEVQFFTADQAGLHLTANETGYYNKSTKEFSKAVKANPNRLAYKDQVFVFDNASLSEVVETINEVYEKKLKIELKETEKCRITVTFKHETIDIIAEVIAGTLSLTLEETEHEIIFKGNSCVR